MRATNMAKIFSLFASCFRAAKAAAPVVNASSNAPAGVPDYVIKYGKLIWTELDVVGN
jgi:hypothetical protein